MASLGLPSQGSPWQGEIKVATSPLPSRGPHGGEKLQWLYQPHPCLLRVPMVGRNQNGYITSAFSGSLWREEIKVGTSHLPPRGLHGEKSKWIHHPYLLGVPMAGRSQNGYITLAFLRSPRRAKIKMATSPLPPHGGGKSKWLHQPCLLGVPMVGIIQLGKE